MIYSRLRPRVGDIVKTVGGGDILRRWKERGVRVEFFVNFNSNEWNELLSIPGGYDVLSFFFGADLRVCRRTQGWDSEVVNSSLYLHETSTPVSSGTRIRP